jgi:hypothetical protein
MRKTNNEAFEIEGQNDQALFTLKVHRGEGMALLAMNWKNGTPPDDFVGFAIEYMEPGGDRFFALKNRLSFADAQGKVVPKSTSTMLAPLQKFRWIHFPPNAELDGDFQYRVKPVFMDAQDQLSYGESQSVAIQLKRQTYENVLNVAFTRGFVSSQAFVDRFAAFGDVSTMLPAKADDGLTFKPTHPKEEEALAWMGFEARSAILNLLDSAIEDVSAQVKVVAYDLNMPEMVGRLEKLGDRLSIIIDNSAGHGDADSAETQAAAILNTSSGGKMKRQHMGQLQHNKTIVVNGDKVKAAVCGSTNFSWRGFYIQANNAMVVYGAKAIQPFLDAFDHYWKYDKVKDFGQTGSAVWNDLSLSGIDAKIAFSPHISDNALLGDVASDMETGTTSSLFYSLAFLYQTEGPIKDAITKLTDDSSLFVYGISDRKIGGLDLHKPDGNVAPVYPSQISKDLPEPFKSEPTGGGGIRMHHKFVVIDFDKPTARVYFGSYNFSGTADLKNGENLVLVRDRKVAVSYMIEALHIFDHYHFRVTQKESKAAKKVLSLLKPPRNEGDEAWWAGFYRDERKIRDRELFA